MVSVSFLSLEDSPYDRNGVEYTVTTGISLVNTISPSSGGQILKVWSRFVSLP